MAARSAKCFTDIAASAAQTDVALHEWPIVVSGDAGAHFLVAFMGTHRAGMIKIDDAHTQRLRNEKFVEESAVLVTNENAAELDTETEKVLRCF